jgi:hypothetical protein
MRKKEVISTLAITRVCSSIDNKTGWKITGIISSVWFLREESDVVSLDGNGVEE